MPVMDTWRGLKKPQGVRAFVGWSGLLVEDESVDVLDMLRAYMRRAAGESCGQCFPCREGLKQIADILDRFCEGKAQKGDRERLEELAHLVYENSRCDIGQTSPQPLLDVLEKAPEILKPRKVTPASYVSTVTAPCISACPSHVQIPDYIEKIRYREFDSALKSVLCDCPMPGTIGRVCVRPCESACKRRFVDQSLAIKRLKRFLADDYAARHPYLPHHKAPVAGRRVAVVGAGPAGLACAYYLTRKGCNVTIFEMQERAGGMARYGIPDYRLPPLVLEREVENVVAEGCEIKYGVTIGKDFTMDDLAAQGYEAVFAGIGAMGVSKMRCPGEDEGYDGFMHGANYLAESARGRKPLSGKVAVVVGGGNVAMDCVRTARRHGFEEVHLIYRRTEQEMPADRQEIKEAREEGVIFNYLVAPLEIVAKNHKVVGLKCQKMKLGEPDASGRPRPVPIKDGEFIMPCDAVIPAIGQAVIADIIFKDKHGCMTEKNTVLADHITGSTGEKNLFSGGDCVTGPNTLIAALAAGKRAANHILRHLSGAPVEASPEEKLDHVIAQLDVLRMDEPVAYKSNELQMEEKILEPKERLQGFMEVEEVVSTAEAVAESRRCMRCYRIGMAAF